MKAYLMGGLAGLGVFVVGGLIYAAIVQSTGVSGIIDVAMFMGLVWGIYAAAQAAYRATKTQS